MSDDLEVLKKKISTASESNDLDFKREIEESKKGAADFIKDVAAFSNYGGGLMVYGVDGTQRVGVDAKDHKKYDTAILHNKVKNHLSPVPNLQTEIIESNGRHFPVLYVEGIEDSVILTTKDLSDETNKVLLRPGEIYLRQNTQSLLVSNEGVLRKILDSVVERRVAKQLSVKEAVLSHILGSVGATKETPPLPKQTINWINISAEKISLSNDTPGIQVELSPHNLESFSSETLTPAFGVVAQTTGETYPLLGVFQNNCTIYAVKDGYICLSKLGKWTAATAFNFNGSMSTKFSFLEDSIYPAAKVLFTSSAARRICLVWDHAFKYLATLKSTATWTIKITVVGIKDRKLSRGTASLPFIEERTSLEDVFTVQKEISLSQKNQAKSLAAETVLELFRLFSLDATSDIEQVIEDGFRQISYSNASIFFPTYGQK